MHRNIFTFVVLLAVISCVVDSNTAAASTSVLVRDSLNDALALALYNCLADVENINTRLTSEKFLEEWQAIETVGALSTQSLMRYFFLCERDLYLKRTAPVAAAANNAGNNAGNNNNAG